MPPSVQEPAAPLAPPPESGIPALSVRGLSAVFNDGNGGLPALERVSFTVQNQEFVCILGPSGSGKSTLLRILAGLLPATEGEVWLEGERLTGPRRGVGFVFQRANLMPWRTVMQNLLLPLELSGEDPVRARAQAEEMIALTGLQGFENTLPRDLSGGMAQRVAIGRALITDPHLMLLDEPFGALDALTRERMGHELLRIWQARRKTVVMVTHSISEALFMADRLIVFTQRPGQVRLDLPINLPRPRLDGIQYTPEFGSLARQVRQAISED